VEIEIAFAGICHSDLHQVRNEWQTSSYPMVPGHEIAGRVTRVGNKVKKVRVGDLAGVGCMVDSCGECDHCRAGFENFCSVHTSWTYNGTEQDRVTATQGGYSTSIVVRESFVLKLAPGLPLERIAPLLCAGITTWTPLRKWNVRKGQRVAVWGLGGLGHMGVKLAAAMGADVTVLSSSEKKRADAVRLGAHDFVVTGSAAVSESLKGRFDLILDTVSATHPISEALTWLRPRAALVLVGAPPEPFPVEAMKLLGGDKILAGSIIGGIGETQAMLDFCAKEKVFADVEVIPMQKVNEAYERLVRSDVRYRFAIDIASLR
jgi:alcohol dehydrogenase (NADP+)